MVRVTRRGWLAAIAAVVIAWVVFVPANPAGAATNVFVVAPGGAGGAYATIDAALDAARQPGSVVEIQAGFYSGDVSTVAAGTADAPIVIRGAAGTAPEDIVLGGTLLIRHQHISVSGFTIDGSVPGTSVARVGDGIAITARYATVTGMRVTNWGNWGISQRLGGEGRQQASHAYIGHNYVYNVASGIHLVGNTVAEYNEIERINGHGRNLTGLVMGDVFRIFGSNTVIRGNYSHGTIREEVMPMHADYIQSWDDINVPVKNILVEDNRFMSWAHQGIMLENDFYGGQDIYLISDWTVRNNVFSGFESWAVLAGKNGGGVQDISIEHNTFVGKADGGAYFGPYIVGRGGSGNIRNNIIVNMTAGARGATEGASATISNNLVVNSRRLADTSLGAGETQLPTIEAVGFVNAAALDYRLTADSVAVDAGIATSVRNDILGVARPQGRAVDIGAYEWTAEPTQIDVTPVPVPVAPTPVDVVPAPTPIDLDPPSRTPAPAPTDLVETPTGLAPVVRGVGPLNQIVDPTPRTARSSSPDVVPLVAEPSTGTAQTSPSRSSMPSTGVVLDAPSSGSTAGTPEDVSTPAPMPSAEPSVAASAPPVDGSVDVDETTVSNASYLEVGTDASAPGGISRALLVAIAIAAASVVVVAIFMANRALSTQGLSSSRLTGSRRPL